MAISRDLLEQLDELLGPLNAKLGNLVARGIVKLVDDSLKGQILQLELEEDEIADDVERVSQYGFTSVPLPGAEAVCVFPDGDRAHPLCIATEDRRHRPKDGVAGEVIMYTDEGDEIRLGRGNIIVLKTGTKIKLGSATASDPVALKSDLTALKAYVDAHRHDAPQASAGSLPTSVPTTTAAGPLFGSLDPSPTPVSATKVDAE